MAKKKTAKKPAKRSNAQAKKAPKKPPEKQSLQPAEVRKAVYASIPKRDYQQLSGRQVKVLNEQAGRYGIPIGGAHIDLGELVRWLHDWFGENGRKLARLNTLEESPTDTDDGLLGPMSPMLERYREEKWKLARLDRQERERILLPRDQVRDCLGVIATVIREAGESLEREFGGEARAVIDTAVDEIERQVFAAVGNDRTSSTPTD